jgi:RNA polymerase sigma factor (sigma-70 family)
MATDPAASDEALARAAADRGPTPKARRSAHDAFQELYDRHANRLIAFLRKLQLPRDEVEDAHQDVWDRVWGGLPTRFQPDNFRGWLFKIAKNVKTDYDRRRKKRPGQLSHHQQISVINPTTGPPVGPLEPEEAARLEHCLGCLDSKDNKLVRARLSGQSYEQVCADLGLTADEAHKRFHRAKQELRDCVGQRDV